MKVGDLVRYKKQPDASLGVIVAIDTLKPNYYGIRVLWQGLTPGIDIIGWQKTEDLEVIDADRKQS